MTRSGAWIGVDFDGTLVTDIGPWPMIGEPVRSMVAFVKQIIESEVVEVRIFTARCFDENGTPDYTEVFKVIEWCKANLGRQLAITCMKDKSMLLLIDDRAVAVQRNTGHIMTYRNDLLECISTHPTEGANE